MTRLRQTRCLRGHDTTNPASRTPGSGNCRACTRSDQRARHTHARTLRTRGETLSAYGPLSDYASLILGDFYNVETVGGLLDSPHPYDPNRLTGTPVSGYGWPEHEAPIVLLAVLLGASFRTSGYPS